MIAPEVYKDGNRRLQNLSTESLVTNVLDLCQASPLGPYRRCVPEEGPLRRVFSRGRATLRNHKPCSHVFPENNHRAPPPLSDKREVFPKHLSDRFLCVTQDRKKV